MSEFSFRPMTRSDLPLFRRWLEGPHLGGWWGDSATEARLVEQDLESDIVDMRIVELKGTPFAFIQDYNAHAFDAPHYKDYDTDARAIDTFLGDPAYLGQGYGAGYIAARAAELRQSYPLVLTDPDPANSRAIAAYRRAGFTPGPVAPAEDGRSVQVMAYH